MRYLSLISASILFLFSCNNANTAKENATDSTKTAAPAAIAAPQSKLDAANTGKLVAFVADYYSLKNAMVAADAAKADEAGKKLITGAAALKTSLAQDSLNGATLTPYIDTIRSESDAMVALKDPGCEKKRIPFGKISDMVYAVLKKAELKNAGVYREYCPMAFNDKGAFWLSAETEIKNPYFGKKMLECGEVTDSL